MYVTALLLTYKRFQQADFLMPWLWTSVGIIVPSPKSTTSVGALFRPWEIEVK